MIVLLKMSVAGKNFGNICLKATKDTLLPICGLWSGEGQRTQFFGVGCIQQKSVVQKFWLAGELPRPQFHLLVGHSDLTIKNTLWRVLGLLTVMNLKRVSESIFFQSNKFTGYKVKNEKEVANSLMVFNLLKITYLAQGKKNLRT